jgi:autoinducer 2-degrading protein
MYVTLVHVHVKPENLQDFIEASLENARESVKEPGNMRFDVLQSSDDPTRFVLYEAYATAEDAAAHKGTVHYQRWRETVADWMAEPRQGIVYNGVE